MTAGYWIDPGYPHECVKPLFFLRTEGMHGSATSRERNDAASVLGVAANAAPEDVKRAYRAQAMRWHPDRHPSNVAEAQERISAINHARDVMLSTAEVPAVADLLAWSNARNTLVEPQSADVVCCFLCETPNRLPAREHFADSRCGKCQALLLYSSQVAQRLFAARQ